MDAAIPPVPARIARLRDILCASDPLDQAIPYRLDRWSGQLPETAPLDGVTKACATPGSISRHDLVRIGRAVGDKKTSVHTLFLAAMVWGFGTVGYGPYRTRLMFESLAERTRLDTTVTLLQQGRLPEAYEGFRVRMCGPAFFTKFFYAVGLGLDLDPLSLVLDSRVAAALRTLHADGALDASRFVSRGRSVAADAKGYAHYVAALNAWAAELGCRADAIERLLFDCPAPFAAPLTGT